MWTCLENQNLIGLQSVCDRLKCAPLISLGGDPPRHFERQPRCGTESFSASSLSCQGISCPLTYQPPLAL